MECPLLLLATTTSNPYSSSGCWFTHLGNSVATTRTCIRKPRGRRSTHCFTTRFRFSIKYQDRQTRIVDDESASSYRSSRSYDHNPTPHCISVGLGWLRCFNFSWRVACRSFFVYLFCLALIVEVHVGPAYSLGYACEDVSSYYAPVEHMEGEVLLKKLNSVISKHRALPYKEVWSALKILDAADVDNPEASSDVLEIYSLRVVPKLLAGKPDGWNREHLWPRSYGLKGSPSFTDLHNLRPADSNVNSSRGNKYYGECLPASTHCLKPASKEAAFDTETDKERWAPPLQVRGDIARAIMYMAVSYGFNHQNGSANLHLSDSPSIKNNEMGLLSTLLKWNELDPPSRAEQLRSYRVCSLYQHNRNPFVDHPEYANLIWKQAIPNIPSHQILGNHSSKAWINEFHYNNRGKDHNEFIEILVGPSSNAAGLKVALYNGANGKMYRFSSLADERIFHETNGGSGFSIYSAFLKLQNGPGDGIALIFDGEDGHSQVIQFISYEGVVKATDGPAIGIESVDIGLQETEVSSELDSLGLTGTGVFELRWKKFENEASPGKLNSGEILFSS